MDLCTDRGGRLGHRSTTCNWSWRRPNDGNNVRKQLRLSSSVVASDGRGGSVESSFVGIRAPSLAAQSWLPVDSESVESGSAGAG